MATDTLSNVFSALADPTRRAILQSLTHGPKSVGEIATPFKMTGPAITKHLKVLERAGLVKTDRRAQWRPRSLEAARLKEAHEWIGSYREFWEQSFDRLDTYLEEIQSKDQTS
jgi:DNA-binding transcriptional ArsR family regulator